MEEVSSSRSVAICYRDQGTHNAAIRSVFSYGEMCYSCFARRGRNSISWASGYVDGIMDGEAMGFVEEEVYEDFILV
jgi:hypothetical protein